jgi:ABC-type dipeptide/oligopeptide/nickel transport system permease subunit
MRAQRARDRLLDGGAADGKATRAMNSFVDLLVPIAVILVLLVLVFGLVNMMRGGSPNVSQKLMRLRVLLQFAAIIVIMGVIWWRAL